MRYFLSGLVLFCLAGCMKVSDMASATGEQLRDVGILEHSRIQRNATWRLQPDSRILIAQGHFAPAGERPPRPNLVVEEAFKGFVEYFPMVRGAPMPLGLEEALAQAAADGDHYVLYTRFAAADDRIGTWEELNDQRAVDRLGLDSAVIQLMLIEVSTRYLVDSARIHNRGGLISAFDARPDELLRRPFAQYARKLLGLSR